MKYRLPKSHLAVGGAIALSLFTISLCSTGQAAEADKANAQKDQAASKPATLVTSPKVKGMQAAIADIEADKMKWNMNMPQPPATAWDALYLQLAKERFKVTLVYNWPIGDQDLGYNWAIRSEVEHRFGEGFPGKLAELQNEAKNTHLKQAEQKKPQ